LIVTRSNTHPEFSKKTVSGFDWIQTTLVPSGSDSKVRRGNENTMLWFPIGNRRYLQVLWRIEEFVSGKPDRWLADAHKMRDQIINSVSLRKID
jgi:hypothetical protein